MKDFYSPKEVAQILGVHEKTVRRYLRDGDILGQKIGGNWKVSKEVLMKYMDQNQVQISMDEEFKDLDSKNKICLRVDIQVKHAKEGHNHAKEIMNVISEYEDCQFRYQMNGKSAEYLLCGSIDFLRKVLDLIEESGILYESI